MQEDVFIEAVVQHGGLEEDAARGLLRPFAAGFLPLQRDQALRCALRGGSLAPTPRISVSRAHAGELRDRGPAGNLRGHGS
jgi:hypothetical protein